MNECNHRPEVYATKKATLSIPTEYDRYSLTWLFVISAHTEFGKDRFDDSGLVGTHGAGGLTASARSASGVAS